MNLRRCIPLLFAVTGLACAQVGTGVVTGRVSDASTAVIPNVRVTVTNEEIGSAAVTLTNHAGIYRATALIPGTYRIEVAAEGFDPAIRKNVTLALAQTLETDFILQVGKQTNAVQVTEDALALQTENSSLGQLVNHKMIDNLPATNRAATSLVILSPGVVMINSGEGAENYPVFSVAGGRARNQDFTLDGGNVTNAVGVTRPQQQTSLPLDAMQEFRVISNNYAAEYGHSTGGIIALSTRSGGNEFHGSIFEFARNNALDARNFFAAVAPPLNLHQFGGSLGGPIRKDKTHFFVSWEETRETFGSMVITTVPTVAEREGDFSAVPGTIYDPLTLAGGKKQPYTGNRIPTSSMDPVAVAALRYIPLPDRGAAGALSNNYGANSHSSLRRDILVGKLDHNITSSDLVTARYYINDYFQQDDGGYRIPVADPSAGTTDGRVQSIMVSYVHIFGPTLTNNLSVSYDRRKFIQQRIDPGAGIAQQIGLANVSSAALPTFAINGYVPLGAPGTINAAVARIQTPITDTQILESLSKVKGKHAFKTGMEYRRGFNREADDITSSGAFSFTRQITDQPGVSNTGDAFASFLTGLANQASLQNLDSIPSHASYWAAYLQDDYRLTDRLTLNAGLRWEMELPRYVESNRMNAFDRNTINPISGTPGVVTFAGINGVPRTAFDSNFANVAPRFGLVYKATNKLVLRGGVGIFYGPMVSNSVGPAASLGFGDNIALVASSADTAWALRLRDGFPSSQRPSLNDPGFGAAPLGAKPNTAVTFFDRNRPTPTSYQVNFAAQSEVARDILMEVGYLGNVSHHLTGNDLSINQVAPELMGPGNLQLLRPFPQFSNVSIINPSIGNSNYHAAFVKVERRFNNGFSILAHYTFSKFLDDVASATEFGDPGSYMDAYNRRLDKGRSGSDIPHRAVVSVLYNMPAVTHNRVLNGALGAWRVALLATLESGQTFTVYDSVNQSNAFSAGTMRPNIVGDPLAGAQTLSHWFNVAAFQSAAPFQFGNSPRSVLRGPAWNNVAVTVSKNFRLTERFQTEVRGELFNVMNHPAFDIPGHTLGNSDFGMISSAEPARTVQLAARLIF